MDAELLYLIRCPRCYSRLQRSSVDRLKCQNEGCAKEYPIFAGVPILLDESGSVFTIAGVSNESETFFRPQGWLSRVVRRFTPEISSNLAERRLLATVARLLESEALPSARVLVVGAGASGLGKRLRRSLPSTRVIETDISFGESIEAICDCHDLPFPDNAFNLVIAQAVLEHVLDPFRCVTEIHRVLDSEGLIYSEAPFMQQVHGGAYDFLRFSHLGFRRLFRWFTEIESGIACGPGMALAWAWEYFLRSFSIGPISRGILTVFARLTGFHLKYADHFLIRWQGHNGGAYDSASAFYFVGRKAQNALTDRELIAGYRGADR